MLSTPGTVLWWGRGDPEYSRNRVLRACLEQLGWHIRWLRPRVSRFGDVEASLRRISDVDLVWVPCFRQRDVLAAKRWASRRHLPVLFDPLISAYDKQVYERAKVPGDGPAAHRLLSRERAGFAAADIVLADTHAHATFFKEVLGVAEQRLHVVPVGAEEALFTPTAMPPSTTEREVLFYGSYLPLQGVEVIVEAARRYRGPPVHWHLVGDGSLRPTCEQAARDLDSVRFSDWVAYSALPGIIAGASLVLGVFGHTPKAQRVIPNKVYQALACARPVVTLASGAYPPALLADTDTGVRFVPAGDPDALAREVAAAMSLDAQALAHAGRSARASYERYFSLARVCESLAAALRPAP